MESEDIFNIQNLQKKIKFVEGSSVQSLQFATYDTPKFKEKSFKNFIMAGPDNMWPNYLIKLTNTCSLHGAIVESVANQVAGEGFTTQDSEDKDQLSQLNDFIRKTKLNKSLKRWALDKKIFGYYFIGITWNKQRTKIANIFHVDASAVRVGKPNEDGIIECFYYSEDWAQYRKNNFKPKQIQRYDPFNRIDESCLLMVREYCPNMRFYGVPDYEACRDAIELSAELTSYMLNTIKNGLTPSLNISFNNGIPVDSEERETIYRSINSLYSGARNAGRFILSFNNSKDNATTIEPINVGNMNEQYAQLGEYAEGQILRGHKTSPILVGLATPGKLGGAGATNELEVSSEDFTNKVILPAQDEIEDTINDLLEVNGFSIKTFIKPCRKLSSSYSDQVMLNALTVDEIRYRMNLPALSDSDKKNLAINITQPDAVKDATAIAQSSVIPDPMIGGQEMESAPVNDNIKNLSAKQHQQLLRIIRQFSKGQITKEVATVLLTTGLGLSQSDVDKMLPDTEDEELAVQTPGLVPYVQTPADKKKKL